MAETLNKMTEANAKPVITVKGHKATRNYLTNKLEENRR